MGVLLIVLVVVVVGVVIALAATIPMARKREDAAIAVVHEAMGKANIVMIEPRTTAMGFEPESANPVRAMSCLAATEQELMAVTWGKQDEWRIQRSAITKVDCEAEDPSQVPKASIIVTYDDGGSEVTGKFRLKDPVPWLTELGYDWGPDGPPEMGDDTDDDEDD